MDLFPRRRALRFLAVGGLGFLVQIAAIVHNSFWHERWTWRDRTHSAVLGRRLTRFAKYNAATGLVALTGNIALTALFLAALHAPAVLANILAVGALTIVNFAVADRWIFRRTNRG